MHWILLSLVFAATIAAPGYAQDRRSISMRSSSQTWVPTGKLNGARWGHTATLLPNGRVLVAGGRANDRSLATAEIYDPVKGSWSSTGSMIAPRWGATAILLPTGKVLVVGGDYAGSPGPTLGLGGVVELYDPDTGTWSSTGSLNTKRIVNSATLLDSGKVLVAGGLDNNDGTLRTSELYDPATGTWEYTGRLNIGRFNHIAFRLDDGRVLVAAGSDDDFLQTAISSAEIYDPAIGAWSTIGNISFARQGAKAALLQNGKVLVAGGSVSGLPPNTFATVDLFDPVMSWSTTGSLNVARYGHASTLLPDGGVLVTGGYDGNSRTNLDSAERYDPATGIWDLTNSLGTSRHHHTATLLADGRVLVAGGAISTNSGDTDLSSAELYGAAPSLAPVIGPGMSGLWFDPAQDGQGLLVEVLPGNRIFAVWLAFNPAGTQQTWFSGVGTYSGDIATIAAIDMPGGGRWIPNFNPAAVVHNAWGSLTLKFTDCNHANAEFTSALGFGTGSVNLTRLTLLAGLSCQ
jgi:N-acetylneuraminic acid mutarotase